MKKFLKNNCKTKAYLENLNKVYSIECAVKWGVREHYFSGKYDGVVPLVWKYYDANGVTDEWVLTKIDSTGWVFFDWTFQKDRAEEICRLLNIRDDRALTDEVPVYNSYMKDEDKI